MLGKLIARDLILNKKLLLIYLAMMTVFFVAYPLLVDEAGVIVVFCCIYLSFVPVSVLAREQKTRSAAITCSFPVRRTTVMLSKYLISASSIVLGVLYVVFLMRVTPFLKFPREEILNFRILAVGTFSVLSASSVLMVFVMWAGFAGLIGLLVGIQLLGAVFLILAKEMGAGAKYGIRSVFGTIGGFFTYLRETLGHPGYPLALLAAGAVLFMLSYAACTALYRRKDL